MIFNNIHCAATHLDFEGESVVFHVDYKSSYLHSIKGTCEDVAAVMMESEANCFN